MQGENILIDIGMALVAATVLAYVARWLRQPLLLAYIGAGILMGPPGLGLIHSEETISGLSTFGLALLMFIVGLETDVRKLFRSGQVVAIVAVLQVAVCALFAFGAMRLFGFASLTALYLGVASAFSSTMIVVKVLSDKCELDTVEGRLTLGILLMQDALAIVVIALQPNLPEPSLAPLVLSLFAGLALVAGALAVSRFVLPPLLRSVAKSPEIVLISAVSWCLFVSYIATLAGFSEAMGALIAGVTLSALPYTLDVVAKIRSLRDFFVTLFFVSLGLQLDLGSMTVLFAALVLSAVVLVGRSLVVVPLLQRFGYGPRVGLLTSMALSQEGELALVIVSVGLALGHIGREAVSITALTLVITSTLSTYMMMVNHSLAGHGVTWLRRLGLSEHAEAEAGKTAEEAHRDVLLVGFHRAASSLLYGRTAGGVAARFLIVDFSPEVFEKLRRMGVPVVYGDISHRDTLAHVGVEQAKVVLSTVSEDFLRGTDNVALLRQVKQLNPNARVILSAETLARAKEMYAAGADYVVLPRVETARAFAFALEAVERGDIDDLRSRAIADLEERSEVMA